MTGGRGRAAPSGRGARIARVPRTPKPCGIFAAGLASDGSDGPTDAAGAIVDHRTCERARARGLDPRKALSSHDAYPLLAATGDLLRTGPTETNVADLALILTW